MMQKNVSTIRIKEITQLGDKKKKGIKKNKDGIRDTWDNIKHINIHTI